MGARYPILWGIVISIDTGDKLVLDDGTVLIPIFSILLGAPLEVTSTPVDKNGDEEDAVEVRDGSSGADDSAPEEAHSPVGDVVGFARVLPPSTCQKTVSVSGLDKGRVLNSATGELRESFAVLEDTLSLHLKSALL